MICTINGSTNNHSKQNTTRNSTSFHRYFWLIYLINKNTKYIIVTTEKHAGDATNSEVCLHMYILRCTLLAVDSDSCN